MHQSHGVDFDVAVYNELQPGKPDPVVRDHGKAESLFRVCQVHHDLGLRPFQVFQTEGVHMERQDAGIDKPLFSRTAHGNFLARAEDLGCIPCPDHRRNPEFPAHDCSVAGPSTFVRDNGSRRFHYRFPVRGRGVRDQDLSRFKGRQDGNVRHNVSFSGCDFIPYTAPPDKHFGLLFQDIGLKHVSPALGLDGLGPCLHDKELTSFPVLCPLDIHGPGFPVPGRVVVFDCNRILS